MRALLVCLALGALAAPARAADPSVEDGSAQAALDQARATWAQHGLTDYGFTASVSCFCPPDRTGPWQLHVRRGAPYRPPAAAEPYSSVLKLFDVVQGDIDARPDHLTVTYGALGNPESITIDHSEAVADDEGRVSASDPQPESSASPPDPSIADGSAARALAAARSAWAHRGLRSYRMRVKPSCFCAPVATRARTVRVRDGKVVRAAKPVRRYATVPKLFALIAGAIRDGAAGLDVRYGSSGLPRHVFIDSDGFIADDELTVDASHLHALG